MSSDHSWNMVAVPPPSPICRRLTVRLPSALRAELERQARASERTASQEVRYALERHLAAARATERAATR